MSVRKDDPGPKYGRRSREWATVEAGRSVVPPPPGAGLLPPRTGDRTMLTHIHLQIGRAATLAPRTSDERSHNELSTRPEALAPHWTESTVGSHHASGSRDDHARRVFLRTFVALLILVPLTTMALSSYVGDLSISLIIVGLVGVTILSMLPHESPS